MIIQVDGITIYFPYPNIYPEQLKYIRSVIQTIKSSGHALVEMPSGTGKTIALLSSTVSYLIYARTQNKPFKIVYCTRTVKEVDKALKELRGLLDYIQSHIRFDFTGVGLSQRGNMCINSQALSSSNLELTCRKMITRLENLRCDFYENYDTTLPPGIYDFDSIRSFGKEHAVCPYFLVRRSLPLCDCIVYTYKYLIDPRVYIPISSTLPRESFIIFDEAHNIDAHCIEAYSVEINRKTLEAASRALHILETSITSTPAVDNKAHNKASQDDARSSKELQTDSYEGTIPYFGIHQRFKLLPGNLRRPKHVVGVMRRLVEFFKTKLKTSHMITEQISTFVESILELTYISQDTLQFCSTRLQQLIQRYNIEHSDLEGLRIVAEFSTMLGVFSKGFSVIFEPYDSMASVFNPVIRLCCLDASIAMSHVFSTFRNVLITSGTLSPIEMYPKLLNFVPAHTCVIGATLHKNLISPLVVTKGNDQMLLESRDSLYGETVNNNDMRAGG